MTQAINASEMGRRAYRAGLKVKDCPFNLRSPVRSWWLKGYAEAKREPKPETTDSHSLLPEVTS